MGGTVVQNTVKQPVRLHCILAMIYFLAVPLTISVNSAGDSFLKILSLPIGICLLILLLFSKEELELNSVHFFYGVHVLLTVLILFVDPGSLTLTIGHIQNAALMFCITLRKYNSRELAWLEYVQIMLLAIVDFLVLFMGESFDQGDRMTLVLFGSEVDPNYLCGFFVLPMAAALKNIFENKSVFVKIICLTLLLAGVYAIFLTGSRGGLLAAVAAIAVSIFLYAGNWKRFIVIAAAAAMIGLVFWTIVLPLLPEDVAERFSFTAVVESRGTYRVDIWLSILDEVKNSTWQLFTGRGLEAQHRMIVDGELSEVVAHNHLIQTIYNQGIPGLIVFVLMMGASILRNIRKRKYVAAAMAGILVLSVSLTFNTSVKPYWNLIMYAALAFPAAGNIKTEGAEDSNNEESNCGKQRY